MGLKGVTEFLQKQTKHSKLFYQYLLPYILILLIPLLFFSAFISGYALKILKEEIHINNMNTLQNAKEVVESQLQNITSVEHKVYLNKMLGEFKMQETMRAVDAKEKLEAYCQINPFLVEVAFYQENSDYIIAASSSCPKKDFWNVMYSYEEWNYEEFQKGLAENEGFFFVKAQNVCIKRKNTQRLVTLVVPLNAAADRCVLLLLDENYFTNVLPQLDKQQELSAIIDEQGTVLVSSGFLEIPEGKRQSSEEIKSERFEIVELDGKEFLWSHVYSEEFHWSYESFTLLNNIENKVVSVQLLVLFLCLLISVAGTIAIIYFMRQNYVPLHTLGVMSGDILKNEENISEIDSIERVLKYLNRQNQQLKTDEENRRENFRELFILKWVTGEYSENAQLEMQAEKIGIKLQRDMYMVAVLCIYRDKIEAKQRALELLRTELREDADVLVGLQTGATKTILVLGYDREKNARVEEVLSACEKLFEFDGCIALGNPTEKKIGLKNSYAEALSALEYRIIIEDQKVIRYEETKSWRGNDALDFNFGQLERYITQTSHTIWCAEP